MVTSDAFFFFGKERGPGGLPVGTSGRVMCLLSGGIDSPVAAWRLIRRGCRATFVHFHSAPILSRTSQDKARAIVETLTRHQLLVAAVSRAVRAGAAEGRHQRAAAPARRRLPAADGADRRAAGADKAGAHALVTGDVLGQVASQTIENLSVVESAATLPILRPLARLRQGRDHARGAAARHLRRRPSFRTRTAARCSRRGFPTTRASRREAEAAEAGLDLEALVSGRRRRRGRGRPPISSDRLGRPPSPGTSEEITREHHSRQTGGHEGRLRRSRRHRRRRDGSARVAEEGAREGQGRRGDRRDDGGVQDPRHRGADAARERDPARSRVGPAGVEARARNAGLLHGVREDRLRQDRARAGCRICSTSGRCGGCAKPAPTR